MCLVYNILDGYILILIHIYIYALVKGLLDGPSSHPLYICLMWRYQHTENQTTQVLIFVSAYIFMLLLLSLYWVFAYPMSALCILPQTSIINFQLHTGLL